MATSNKAVTTYLPPQLEESLTEYCLKHGLTRKSKSGDVIPSLGTGIVEALKDRFELSEEIDTGLSKRLEQYFESSLSSKVQDLVKDLVKDSRQPSQSALLKRIAALEEKVMYLEPEKVQDESEVQGVPGQLELLESSSTSQADKSSTLLEISPITGKKLSELRLGLSQGALSSKKRESSSEELAEWTKGKDPDGIPWKFVRKPSRGYIPAEELFGEQESRFLQWSAENNSV